MNKRIIYPNNESISIIIPAEQTQETIDIICKKDVPAGVPYKIVDASAIPDDRTFRDAWTADFSEPDGYGIGAKAYFTNILSKDLSFIEKEIKKCKDIISTSEEKEIVEMTKLSLTELETQKNKIQQTLDNL